MYRWNQIAVGRIAGKVDSPVGNETTGQSQGAFTNAIVTELEREKEELQNKLTITEKKLSSALEDLQKAEEMQQELLTLRNDHWLLKVENGILKEQQAIVESMPRLAGIRVRTLDKLKMGKQSVAGKAINAFIKEINAQLPTPNTQVTTPSVGGQSWKVGDKCSVKMPSGTIITDAVIASIQKSGTCKIHVPETDSHFTADLSDLVRSQ